MVYKIVLSSKFKTDFKKLSKTDKDLTYSVLLKLAYNEKLEERFKDHNLKGNLKNMRECHIKPDLLLIYSKNDTTLIIQALRVTSHSNAF